MSGACTCHLDPEQCWWCLYKAEKEKVERYEQFIRACQYAGKGGLPILRIHANQLLRGDLREVDLSQILRKEK
ncbi:hypothetical protein [Bacillus sp. Hm123]|uniref:hypothetical protein n=1 Tax=Bacillus sp. Hm123 TaxID=3450745 RepID=UPI003F42F341